MATLNMACQCGHVKIRLTGKPVVDLYCHCQDCQRITGAGCVSYAVNPQAAVGVSEGDTMRWALKSNQRKRCTNCGTYLFGMREGMHIHGIGAYLLPSGAFKPQMHIMCKDAVCRSKMICRTSSGFRRASVAVTKGLPGRRAGSSPKIPGMRRIRTLALGGLLGALVTSVCCAASLSADAAVAPAEWINDLRPITAAEWAPERAAHLLERAGFGALPTEVHHSLTLVPRAVVAALIRPQGADDPSVRAFEPAGLPDAGIDPFPETRPLATDAAKARSAAIGIDVKPSGNRPLQPVVDKFFFWLRASMLECNRIGYWWANRTLVTRRPLVEKMALLWHGHFATHEDTVRDYRKMLGQVERFQRSGLGNFRELMIAVAQDPAMLAFLDAGVKGAPNENFAR